MYVLKFSKVSILSHLSSLSNRLVTTWVGNQQLGYLSFAGSTSVAVADSSEMSTRWYLRGGYLLLGLNIVGQLLSKYISPFAGSGLIRRLVP